jgi:large subunit ribosomal protein L22
MRSRLGESGDFGCGYAALEVEAMDYKATYRFARISARKVRPMADLVRGRFADEALEILRFQPQRGARLLEKVIKSALGNARDPDNPANKGRTVDVSRLIVADAQVNGGPMFKRVRPRARGMAFMILRRFSHNQITLSEL